MKIVLMADNRKMELLVNFCIAYKTLLTKHQLISVYNTAKHLKASVDIDVSKLYLLLDVIKFKNISYSESLYCRKLFFLYKYLDF